VAGRRSIALALPIVVAALAVSTQAGADSSANQVADHAVVIGVKLMVPGQAPVVSGAHAGAPPLNTWDGAFAYPDDASLVQVGTVSAQATAASQGTTVTAQSDLAGLSLFAGEITADQVTARATATVDTADFTGTALTNLVVEGQPVTAQPQEKIPLADWGNAVLMEQEQSHGTRGQRAWVTALDITLSAAHAGLPVGTRILVGYAEAGVSTTPPKGTPPPTTTTTTPSAPTGPTGASSAQTPGTNVPSPLTAPTILNDVGLFPSLTLPPPLQASITSQGYVFPVFGPSSYGDTFGAPRGDVSGGWHHGDDIFAPLGAPLLAVADGTVFSVGPNPIGGNRLWLQDSAGNQYYYAHLSAYSPLARDGQHVHAGDVLGFVGNTGDAAGGPYHLHFEVHPASLLFLGYDGAVDPTPYLDAWRRLQTVTFPAGVAWAPQPLRSRLPPPGAMLLQSNDISTASGLDPASFRQALSSRTATALLDAARSGR
jgi:murein DD-endopeptidase MepM/ murein hydrolase activator NlpD